MKRRLLGTAGTVILALTLGCAGTSIQTFSKPAVGQREYGRVKKVAMLPFDSVVEGAEGPRFTGDLFIQELLSRETFEVVEEPRYVAELMKKLKLRNTENLDREIVRKIGEELQAQALILGTLLLFGVEENSEIVEFALRINVLEVETGDILWAGRSFSNSSTSVGEILGVNQGPSTNEVARGGVAAIVKRLDNEFRDAREREVERMLEAAKVEELAEEAAPEPEEGAPEAAPEVAPEAQDEEILLQVKPK
jgi:hypothetical protein